MTREEAISWLRELIWHEGEDVTIYDTDVEAINMAIEALKQEHCEDVVSRKTIDQNIYDYAESNGLSYANLKNAILDAPSVKLTQKWIPITEKLPEDKQRVLVTRESGTIGYITWNTWWNGQRSYPIDRVIAWMPMPQPYNRESRDER